MPPSDPEDRAHRPSPGADAPAPVLRRQPAPESPIDGIDAPFAAARLTALAHELANLLDGSMRCLGLAQRSLSPSVNAPTAALLPDPDLARRLDTVGAALMQMTELVRAAMAGVAPDAHLGRRPGLVESWPLETAIRHAADILAPVASAHAISISLALDPSIAPLRAGTLYAPVAAAVRNAIESIQRTQRGRGEITISARVDPDELTRGIAIIEIADDGAGPPALPTGHEARVFELGFTTKRASPHPAGIGLSMVRDAVRALGGSVELAPRVGGGAVLRIIYPVRENTTPAAGGPTPC